MSPFSKKHSRCVIKSTTRKLREFNPADRNDLEANIVDLAMNGRLAGAAQGAIRQQRAMGMTITYKEGESVIRLHPDGTKEQVSTLTRRPYRLPDSVARF